MSNFSVSVVVASHGRPESLLWCLAALAGQAYEPYEIVVVADLAACAYVSESRFAARVKLVPFEEPNIAAARNKGVAEAAGEIIAFVDDDANGSGCCQGLFWRLCVAGRLGTAKCHSAYHLA